jgi:hypothetical protein
MSSVEPHELVFGEAEGQEPTDGSQDTERLFIHA